MNKNNQRLRHILILLAVLILSISMLSCSEKKPRVKRSDASDDTVVEENSKDVVVQNNPTNTSGTANAKSSNQATSRNSPSKSANPFDGTWDVDVNGSFANWTFGYASKNGDKLEGKITDGSSSVIGDYVVLPNKTIELNIYAAGINNIVPYQVSNGGNQIEVNDGTTKVILTKGKSNTTIQNDANMLASKSWNNINNSNDFLDFKSVIQSSAGWTGSYDRGGNDYGTFTMTPGKITFNSQANGSVQSYSYKIRNTGVLDLTDSKGNTETFN